MASIFLGRAFRKNLIDKLLNCQTKIGGACAKFFFGLPRVKRERGRTVRLVVAGVIRLAHGVRSGVCRWRRWTAAALTAGFSCALALSSIKLRMVGLAALSMSAAIHRNHPAFRRQRRIRRIPFRPRVFKVSPVAVYQRNRHTDALLKIPDRHARSSFFMPSERNSLYEPELRVPSAPSP